LERNAQIDPTFEVIVVERNGLAKSRDGFDEVAALREGEAERVVGFGAFRGAFDGSAQLLEGNRLSLWCGFGLCECSWNKAEENS
jgi:hypothetical protein